MKTRILKKILPGVAALLAFTGAGTLSGCDDGDAPAATVIGTWTVAKTEGYEIIDGQKDTFWDTYESGQYTMQFDLDETGVEIFKEKNEVPDYKPFTYKYAASPGWLLLTYKGEQQTYDYEVENLTSTMFVISRKSGDKDGVNETFIRYYMNRIKK